MRRFTPFFILVFISGTFSGCGKSQPSSPPPRTDSGRVELTIADVQVSLELVSEPGARSRGLMFRDSLAPNSGMLFVFPREGVYPFWMKNTRMPLSIAFLDRSGRIVGLDEMQPFDTLTLHMPRESFLYAVEMDSGWFRAHGVGEGDTIELPPFLTLTPR